MIRTTNDVDDITYEAGCHRSVEFCEGVLSVAFP